MGIDTFIDNAVLTERRADHKANVSTSTKGLGNITLSGEQALNGLTTSASRVFVVEQTDASENGIYLSSSGAWVRTSDANSSPKVTNGMVAYVGGATSTRIGDQILLVTPGPIVLGTTLLTFETIANIGVPAVHALAGAEHSADTLANLNTKISDATLIDTADSRLSDARTPTAHNLGGAEHSADTLANLNTKVSDATLIDTADSRLSDARTPTLHNLGGAEHGADTLANLNTKISDATLDPTSILDADGDTGIQAEAVADEDIVRFRIGGANDKFNIGCPFTDTGINSLIDSLGTEGGMGVLPEGTYTMTGAATIDQDNTVLRGTGWGTILDGSAFSGAITYINVQGGQDQCVVSDMKFLGNDGPGDTERFISATGCDHLRIYDNLFVDSDFDSVALNASCPNFRVVNNFSLNADTIGFRFASSDIGLFLGNTMNSDATGANFDSGCDNDIIAFTFAFSCGTGLNLSCDKSIVMGNLGLNNTTGITTTLIQDTTFIGNRQSAPAGTGFNISGGDHDIFIGNSVNSGAQRGFHFLSGATSNVIMGCMVNRAGNTFDDYVIDGSDKNVVIGCIGTDAAVQGERGLLLNNADSNIVMGQHFSGHDTAGIALTGTSDNNVIMFNHLDGELVARITDTTGLSNNIIWDADTLNMIVTTNTDLGIASGKSITLGSGKGSITLTDAATDTIVFSDANVGINTTGGLARLSINGGVHVGGDSDPGDNNLLVDGTLEITGVSTLSTSVTVPLVIGGTSTTSDLSFKTTTGVGIASADMHFLVGNNGATEAMTILNNGRVGMGTIAPNAGLDTRGAAGGSVGGFPSGGLHVTGPSAAEFANAVITGHNLFSGNTQLWYLGSVSSSNNNITLINRQSGSITFFTSNVQRVLIAADGKVGIGTNTGLAQLSINGGVHVGGDSNPGDNNLLVDGTLEVTGVVTFSNDLTVANGGTGASTFTDGGVLLGSGTGAITAMAVLADGEFIVGDGTTDPIAESGATVRTSLGLGTGDSPTFTNLTLTDIEINGALNHDGTTVGFYGTTPISQQTGVAVTDAAIHAALVSLGLITA